MALILWILCVPINLIRLKIAVDEIKSYGRELDIGGIIFMSLVSILFAPMMTCFVLIEYILERIEIG